MWQHSVRSRTLASLIAFAACAQNGAAQTDCNANGVPDDEEVGWQFESLLVAADGEAADQLGAAVDAHGDLVVVGASREDTNGTESGAAYVFRRAGQTWMQEARLEGSDNAAEDYFGYAVAVGAGTIAVAALGHDAAPPSTGAVYVFHHDGVSWQEQAKLLPPDLPAYAAFGRSIALDGDLLVVGASGASLGCEYSPNTGAAYVFRHEADGWTFLQKLTASDASLEDEFGYAVAIAGSIIVVGAHQEGHSGPGGSYWDGRGAAYVFEWNGDSWEETAKLQASNPLTDGFGVDVAATAERVVVGANGDTFAGISGAGAVYVFEPGPQGWHETIRLGASDATSYDLLGGNVAVQGDIVVASASVANPGGVPSMAAYLFSRTDTGWVQEAKVFGSGVLPDGAFWGDVALYDRTLALGDTKDATNGTNAGAVHIYHGFRDDCNANGVPDGCDVTDKTSVDCDEDGVPDECQPDCNLNDVNDRCDIESAQSEDCNSDGVPDECQGDCNGNAVPDPCDILAGTSSDCQADGIPDECQLAGTFRDDSARLVPIHGRHPQIHTIHAPPLALSDVTLTFTATANLSSYLEFVSVTINATAVGNVFVGGAHDCPYAADTDTLPVPAATFNASVAGGDAVIRMTPSPDVTIGICDVPHITVSAAYGTLNDCNGNGVPDECDIAGGGSSDCQANGVPDECEADCNGNGIADACDIGAGTSSDCQNNGVPDECDITAGDSEDCTGNGVPDECDRDCNKNGLPDLCEALADPTKDCDGDGILDECILDLATWTLVATDPAPDEAYGDSVAMHGDVLVVGSPDSDSSWVDAGAVHVYRFDGVRWRFEQRLLPADPSYNSQFGRAVAVHGDIIFVGAISADGGTANSGAAYEFGHTEDGWQQLSKIVACDSENMDYFGYSIAAEADLLVVGAIFATGSGQSQGAAYVYERISDEWVQSAKLMSPNGRYGENFGYDVAVSDGTVAIGTPGDFGAEQPGSVYLFRKDGTGWATVAELVPFAGDDAFRFGSALAMKDGRIVVGAYGDDSMGAYSGAAYIFEHNGAEWVATTKLTPPEPSTNAMFGSSVSIADDDTIVVASRRTAGGDAECMACVYDYNFTEWIPRAQYPGSTAPAPYFYRCSVGAAAQTVVLGDTRDDGGGANSGAVYVFTDYGNDCDMTGILDACEIADGTSQDLNQNGIPDECEIPAPLAEDGLGQPCQGDQDCGSPSTACIEGVCYVMKNRYISLDPSPANAGSYTARRVSLYEPGGAKSVLGWVGEPVELAVAGPETTPQLLARIEESPHYRDWSVDDAGQPWVDATIHVGDCETSAGRTYIVQAIVEGMDTGDEANYSAPLMLHTANDFGDVVGASPGDPPDGVRNFRDISAVVRGFQSVQTEPKVWLDLQGGTATPEIPDFSDISFGDITQAVAGFQGAGYPFAAPCACPGQACP